MHKMTYNKKLNLGEYINRLLHLELEVDSKQNVL